MSIWKDSPNRQPPSPTTTAKEPERSNALPTPDAAISPSFAPEPSPVPSPAPAARAETDRARKESLIAADITIEGKIEGTGSVRIAGKFKGDVNVQGDLNIEVGAKLTGGVRADKVVIAGELEGNIENASCVELLPTGVVVGDVKSGSLTVAAGARMRGQVDFGWDDGKTPRSGKPQGAGNPAESGVGP